MLTVYPAIFYPEKTGDYSVIFPDLNHLSTWGENIEDAMRMAIDCLASYIHSEKIEGHSIPAPTPINQVDIHCEDDAGDNCQLPAAEAASLK